MKNKKWITILFTLLLVGGASVYGYHLLSTPAVNEFNIIQNPGGRLHDDFNGQLMVTDDYAEKRIYVENFTQKDKRGVPLFVRVQIREYMEIGQGAGGTGISANKTSTKDPIKIVGDGLGVSMNRNKKETWNIYMYDELTPVGEALSMYRTMRWAGEELKSPHATSNTTKEGEATTVRTRSNVDIVSNAGIQTRQIQTANVESHTGKKVYYYMPTFNRNKESMDPDVNGSIKGAVDPDNGNWTENSDATNIKKRYNNYVEYNAGDKKTGKAIYAGNDTTPNDIVQDSPKEIEEEHMAKELLETKVISMKQWRELPETEQIGQFWVYDEDGWAYWAEPLQPETATSMLLKGIELHQVPSSEWYYGISVVGEFASLDAAKEFAGIQDETLFFLSVIKNKKPEISGIQNVTNDLKVDNCIFAQAGKTTTLKADVKVLNPTGGIVEKDIMWSAKDPEIKRVLDGNLIRPTNDLVGKKYTLTVTSQYDTTKSKDVTLYVYPSDAVGMVRGSDQMIYVQYSNNVYRTFSLSTGEIFDEWICAGADQLIGTGDDLYQVLDAGRETAYGRHFLGPIGGKYYQYSGADGKLGTSDDKYLMSLRNDFPNDLTAKFVKKINIIARENGEELTERFVHPGTDVTFEAELIGVDDLPLPMELQKVRWECSATGSVKQDRNNSSLVVIAKNATSNENFKMEPISDLVDLNGKNTPEDYYVVEYTWKEIGKIDPDLSRNAEPMKVKIGSQYWLIVQNNTVKKQAYLLSETLYPIGFDTIKGMSTPAVELNDWESNPTPWTSELQPSIVTKTINQLLEESIDIGGSEKIKDRAVHSIIEDKQMFDNTEAGQPTTQTRMITKQMFLPSLADMGYHSLTDNYRSGYLGNEYTFQKIASFVQSPYIPYIDWLLTRTVTGQSFKSANMDLITGEPNINKDKSGLWYGLSIYKYGSSPSMSRKDVTCYYKPAMVFYYGEDDPSKHIGTPITP